MDLQGVGVRPQEHANPVVQLFIMNMNMAFSKSPPGPLQNQETLGTPPEPDKTDRTDRASQTNPHASPKRGPELPSKRQAGQSVGAGGDREASFNPPALSVPNRQAEACGTSWASLSDPSAL